MYSEQFRSYFSINCIMEKENSNNANLGKDLETEPIVSNSNKSILESLLN